MRNLLVLTLLITSCGSPSENNLSSAASIDSATTPVPTPTKSAKLSLLCEPNKTTSVTWTTDMQILFFDSCTNNDNSNFIAKYCRCMLGCLVNIASVEDFQSNSEYYTQLFVDKNASNCKKYAEL